jgi:hypothetical protein
MNGNFSTNRYSVETKFDSQYTCLYRLVSILRLIFSAL